ncbi:hypothetical protein [Massilia sp. LC238]|uniref:hypothetical protein n=1 Tax=Massilia sp. LC238 TaxID=1502852 RepID=UPI0004E2B8A8|nr:hypothetical protein [Massilia sp. LC238]KFC61893.1 hypothetical protein FG94_04933 [Massilia sp. LC238]
MMQVILELHQNTVADLIKAATVQGMEFKKYVEMRLNADLDQVVEEQAPANAVSADDVEDIAQAIFTEALSYPANKQYLVEKVYGRLNRGDWSVHDRGTRIRVGKAFKRLVDAQSAGGTQLEHGYQMKVRFLHKNAQNQAVYQTERVG